MSERLKSSETAIHSHYQADGYAMPSSCIANELPIYINDVDTRQYKR